LTSGVLVATGGAMYAAGYIKAGDYDNRYENQITTTDAVYFRKERDNWVSVRNCGAVLGVSGCVVFPFNFFIAKKSP
jgi:hypothetical protein